MKNRVRLLYLLLCLIAATGFAQEVAQSEIRPLALRGNLHVLLGPGSNVIVSSGPDGSLLVDDEYAALNDKLRATLGGLQTPAVKIVINTHWHEDHTGGNESFGRDGAIIIAHENAGRRMQTDQTMSLYGRQAAYPAVAWPRITLQQSLQLHWNADDIDVIAFDPSHTDGDLAIFFRRQNVLATGDLFVTNEYLPPYFDDLNGGSTRGMIAAADRLLELVNAQTIIVPGHGAPTDRNGLQQYRDRLVAIRDRIQSALAQGLSEDAVVASHPADGFAPRGKGTDRWTRILYREYRR